MSQVIVIKSLCLQNANAIAGLSYGFPAITNFLGFAHKLSRNLPADWGIHFPGLALICHQHQVHAKQPKGWGDYVFALSRNPLTARGETAPIIEEGRMDLQLSLILQIAGLNEADEQSAKKLVQYLTSKIPAMRLAGGQITNQPLVTYHNCYDEKKTNTLLRALMPGFALVDRQHYLQQHHKTCVAAGQQEYRLFDAWCDFAALKYYAVAEDEHRKKTATSRVKWHYLKNPAAGYLVPLMVGYRAISELFPPGEVANVRDAGVAAVFAEAAYSVGEWLSPHRALNNLDHLFWRYRHQAPWYIAATAQQELLPNLLTEDEPY